MMILQRILVHGTCLALLTSAIMQGSQLGDVCTCTNTGLKGIMLPNPQAGDKLECNCHNLALQPNEYAEIVAPKIIKNDFLRRRFFTRFNDPKLSREDRTALRSMWVLAETLCALQPATQKEAVGPLTIFNKSQSATIANDAQRSAIYASFGLSKPFSRKAVAEKLGALVQTHFWFLESLCNSFWDKECDPKKYPDRSIVSLKDSCSSIGEACVCSNTSTWGVCTINAPQKDAKGNELCFRCKELSCVCH